MTTARPSTRTRRRPAVAAALALTAVIATACPAEPSAPAPTFPCRQVSSVEVQSPIALTGVRPPGLPPDTVLDFPYPAPMAEATSDDGVIHAWVVAERRGIGLGSWANVQLRVFARNTTTGEPPSEVYRAYLIDHMFPSDWYGQRHEGYPELVDVSEIDPSGDGAVLSVTYGKRSMSISAGEGDYVGNPFRSFTYELAC